MESNTVYYEQTNISGSLDSDRDGVNDIADNDDDNDGIPDGQTAGRQTRCPTNTAEHFQ